MGWLSYSDDEVESFHTEIQAAARKALEKAELDNEYEWKHHPPRRGGGILPDFVLLRRNSGEWIEVVEIKRRRESVFSTRNQYQAKSYAEANAAQFPGNRPKFFCITNLEVMIVFALNSSQPPLDCQIKNGLHEFGSFKSDPQGPHKDRFIEDLAKICKFVVSARKIEFERVWPSVLDNLIAHIGTVHASRDILSRTPTTPNWPIVESYFGTSSDVNASRLFLMRCLVAEYLRGTLQRWNHPRASEVPPLKREPSNRIPSSVASTIEKLRTIDFLTFFEESCPEMYRKLTDPGLRDALVSYVSVLVPERVAQLAAERVDFLELLDTLFSRLYPIESLPLDGKIQTDHELADILAALTIPDKVSTIYDPGCGTGALLSAAFDRQVELHVDERTALESLYGLDADDISGRIASLRVALKMPKALIPELTIKVDLGDLFCNASILRAAQVVLMNPPFRRYEAQDSKPVPVALKNHYATAIKSLDGKSPVTTIGQANLFNYYVEFIIKAARPGTRIGIVLDNKWYHSQYEAPLRKFLLEETEVLAIVEYPHSLYFTSFAIATSLLVVRKVDRISDNHKVRFIRSKNDPQLASIAQIAAAMHTGTAWPRDWSVSELRQKDLDEKTGWKKHFQEDFENDFFGKLVKLRDVFEYSRRGSLNKEGGGTGVIDFPFNQTDYGPRRLPIDEESHRPWRTNISRDLTRRENEKILESANRIPSEYRGWAIRNSDDLGHYLLTSRDVTKVQTLEPPLLREQSMFFSKRRTEWTSAHDEALEDMMSNPDVAPFIASVDKVVGLNEETLPREELWVSLREPYAGELIVPRKMRVGHRVHVNPFPFEAGGRQVRISSNLISYTNCLAVDERTGLDRALATKLVAAFLASSFGQVQFEREGYNREGALAVEKDQVDRIKVLDPREIEPTRRKKIVETFMALPYPVRTDRLSTAQKERNRLDELFAADIARVAKLPRADVLLQEVHGSLDEWLEARRP